ncbi:leukocyte surface antigen CD53 isoform X2 [Salmo salar]|uniref:Leukocyte surface antigen CD53 isoform X2 n=1 Tax=Salmo salar TaxID=8030 RepID=A0A1S3NP14_SALSA|nr:leukocyte surface antigen CD53-like isoform X2 [Salmo salar]|eukprot:XP_014017178.1 PREDICTED: leukocyte surface antigen CD53-like isoform X3 [Salmo salar]
MAQNCLKCLKYTMCVVNFLCFICGTAGFGFGVFMMMNSKVSSLIPSLSSLNIANMLFITGIIMTCVSFLGFLGALKENHCLLVTFFILLFILMLVELTAAFLLLLYESKIDSFLQRDLTDSLEKSREPAKAGNLTMSTGDWDIIQTTGCYNKLKAWFEENFLATGAAVIVLCIIEVLGMCFSVTLFCHISQSGLSYKL